jgi:hypothetical protein
MVAFKTCIGFLDPSIVAEQSLMPAEVRTRWMIGGTISPNPEDQLMYEIDRKIRHTGWSSTEDDRCSSKL